MQFKAVIPAAGEGRRLKPHTHTTPKILLQVAGKPIIGHIMDRLLPARPDEVIVVVGAQGDQVKHYLTSEYRCPFRFLQQTDPRGLGDAVYRAKESFSGEPVLVLLGDTIVDLDMSRMVGRGNLIGVKEVADPRRFGVVELRDGYVSRFVEKPDRPQSNLAIVGVYFFRESGHLFDALGRLIAQGRTTKGEFQLTDALQLMVNDGTKIRTRTIKQWLDCGTREAMLETNRYLLTKEGHYKSRAGTVIIPPVFIHDRARIQSSIIGPNASIGADADIQSSIIWDSIVNQRVVVRHTLLEGSILGENSVVRDSPRRLNLGGFSELEMG
ncbi:MAG TPA: sugar phosphate nucleotidyltransferase [bacterium]|nr:sugar phosphate nucleotidyltransferase [bacterium]